MVKTWDAAEQRLRDVEEDARTLIAATADTADEKIRMARERMHEALEMARETVGNARERLRDGARSADTVVRGHPYESIAIAFGVGLLAGLLVHRR